MTDNLTKTNDYNYDAIVVGAGHAGIEAGLALARTGQKTLMLSITLDNVGYLACNPSIGGTAKGHLVREIDALGGEMGIAADKSLTQLRMLNLSKGPAVHSLRAQVDKYKYHEYMKDVLENQPRLFLKQAEVKDILYDGDTVKGIRTTDGREFFAKAVIVASGVYLKSTIIKGSYMEDTGPASFGRATYLSDSLKNMGLNVRRFKTGTPARVHKKSVNLAKLELQEGEDGIYSFSEMSKKVNAKKGVCYLGYTNEKTHDLIRDNLNLAPKYAGLIDGVGARYCPSIEDKIVRFADKDRHQFFLEPEGERTQEMYVQGISTSLPPTIQLALYRTIEGFEKVEIMRDAYAIEYDCIDPTELYPTLQHMNYKGLYFAGQINGTSGYEEAAAQGLVAGINCSLALRGKDPIIFGRENSYIGVMIDDLVTCGTDEPYRMMTSRAEYRLYLRQDNADLRLTEIGRQAGLVTDKRYKVYQNKLEQLEFARSKMNIILQPDWVSGLFEEAGEPLPSSYITLKDVIKRGGVTEKLFTAHIDIFASLSPAVICQLFSEIKYEGYLARQHRAREEQRRMESSSLPPQLDYATVEGLRIEAREKLAKIRPLSLGQASRISGVNPADINVLIIHLKRNKLL